MMLARYLVLVLCIGSLASSEIEAKVYQYTDDTGRKVFVDRLSKIPAKYREKLKARDEEQDQLSDQELQDLSTERDLKRLKLKINRQRADIRNAMKAWITPFSFQANRILIPVKVVYGARSLNLNLVMDTGASHTIVHKSAIDSLGAQLLDAGVARIADGSIVKTEKINFDRVEIGPYKIDHITAGVIDYRGGSNGNQGLLGMDFLYNAQYELDKQNKQIIWAPEKYNKLKEQLLKLEELEQRLKEKAVTPGHGSDQ